MTSGPDRKEILELVDEAEQSGARRSRIAEWLGLHARTLRRWRKAEEEGRADRRPTAERPRPVNALSEEEREAVLELCNQPEYAHLPPSQIVPRLADEGIYLASESTFYRILREAGQATHRGRAQPPQKPVQPQPCRATGPNQVWSWDITYLAAAIRGTFYRLYMVEDIFSRKIVGWEIHEQESAAHASTLISKACLREGIRPGELVLHADNGGPMKGATMLATLQRIPRRTSISPSSSWGPETLTISCPCWMASSTTTWAVALDDMLLLSLPVSRMRKWLTDYPPMNRNMLHYTVSCLRHMENLATDLALHDTLKRLANLILRHVDSSHGPQNCPYPVHLIHDLKHEKLAQMIGSVRQVVNQHLQKLKKSGALEHGTGKLFVRDLELLKNYAEGIVDKTRHS